MTNHPPSISWTKHYPYCARSVELFVSTADQQTFSPPVVPLSLVSDLISSNTCKNAIGSSAPCTSYFPLSLHSVSKVTSSLIFAHPTYVKLGTPLMNFSCASITSLSTSLPPLSLSTQSLVSVSCSPALTPRAINTSRSVMSSFFSK